MYNMEKKFSDDNIFNAISKEFLSWDQKAFENNILNRVIDKLIHHMKLSDSLFEKLYQNIIYCGSFYKGTKIEKPNEFDLNIILQLPLNYDYVQFLEKTPGHVQLRIENEAYNKHHIYNKLTDTEKRSLHKYIFCSSILNPDKFRFWIKSIINKLLKKLSMFENMYVLEISSLLTAYIKMRENGPAFTIIFNIANTTENISVDLVPALSFDINVIQQFTSKFHILKECRNKKWFAIPIPLNNLNCITSEIHNICWRIAFSHQENEFLKKYGNMKPVIRQLKKFRDTQNWKSIASYYIETLFLNKVIEAEINVDKMSRTFLFFTMLEELCNACEQQQIKWFWDERYNLLSKIGKSELYNISQRLKNIINDIKKNSTDQFIIAKYILNSNELKVLQMRIQDDDAHQDSPKEQEQNKNVCFIF